MGAATQEVDSDGAGDSTNSALDAEMKATEVPASAEGETTTVSSLNWRRLDFRMVYAGREFRSLMMWFRTRDP